MSPLWRKDFAAFLNHVGPRPGAGYSIERIDNACGYEPGNVRWATAKEQARNTRRNRMVMLNGARMTVAEAAEHLGIHYNTLHGRVHRVCATTVHPDGTVS